MTAQSPRALELPYRWAGTEGRVKAWVEANADPAAHGCAEFARGFPICRATVEPPAVGYADALGWLQMLDYSGRPGGFQIDAFAPLGEVDHPFAFYGFAPTFFDAPHSDEFENWDFAAHTFLGGLGGELFDERRDIRAVTGFSWGFSKRGSKFEFRSPQALAAAAWDRHLEYLEKRFPRWRFASGFRQHPLQ
jgi:hypothetical protein